MDAPGHGLLCRAENLGLVLCSNILASCEFFAYCYSSRTSVSSVMYMNLVLVKKSMSCSFVHYLMLVEILIFTMLDGFIALYLSYLPIMVNTLICCPCVFQVKPTTCGGLRQHQKLLIRWPSPSHGAGEAGTAPLLETTWSGLLQNGRLSNMTGCCCEVGKQLLIAELMPHYTFGQASLPLYVCYSYFSMFWCVACN